VRSRWACWLEYPNFVLACHLLHSGWLLLLRSAGLDGDASIIESSRLTFDRAVAFWITGGLGCSFAPLSWLYGLTVHVPSHSGILDRRPSLSGYQTISAVTGLVLFSYFHDCLLAPFEATTAGRAKRGRIFAMLVSAPSWIFFWIVFLACSSVGRRNLRQWLNRTNRTRHPRHSMPEDANPMATSSAAG